MGHDTTVEPMSMQAAIRHVVDGRHLTEAAARAAATTIMDGTATVAQIAGLLVALRAKGESTDEIVGFALAMRERAEHLDAPADVIDTCGTGGDGRGTFNISTIAALVAAGAGCRVAKHGNRAVSGRCGSAEVLEALGVPIDVEPAEASALLERIGIAFLFAPRYHPAARQAAVPRREIGVRSIFNIVGPLTNPAGARRQLVGVFDARLVETVAHVLARLGAERALVVHGSDGIDEITLTGPSRVAELDERGDVRVMDLDPRPFGFRTCAPEDLQGGDSRANARIARGVLDGRPGPARDVVLINAGAAIHVAGRAPTLAEGIERARESIDSGRARARLDGLAAAAGVTDA
jgi:anthranilate phosphoribosyltransferase